MATALVALSRWGWSCWFAGVRGDDDFGSFIEDSLVAEGILTDGLVVRTGESSQFAFILVDPCQAQRTILWLKPSGRALLPDEVNLAILEQARIFHTDGLFIESALWSARRARERGIPVVVDAGTLREGMMDLAALSDYFIASETFAAMLPGSDNPLEACRILADMGPRVAAVTCGERGYAAMADGKLIRRSAYPVEAVDTTGCGDVFHAGFIQGILNGYTCERSLDLASWTAARASLHLGGRGGIPGLKELRSQGY